MANQGLVRWQPRAVVARPTSDSGGVRRIGSIFDEFDRLFDDAFLRPSRALGSTGSTHLGMAVDLTEDDSRFVVEASLPGVKPSDVDVSLAGTTLRIAAKRQSARHEGGSFLIRERWSGDFTRLIELPVEVDADRVEAVFEHGTLRLTLPKAQAYQPRRIEVKAIG